MRCSDPVSPVACRTQATISWNLIASYYHGLAWYGTALMTASEPWSGAFDDVNVGVLWATAHTTHFTQPG